MKVVHLTVLLFTQILLASFIFYSVSAATLQQQHQQQIAHIANANSKQQAPQSRSVPFNQHQQQQHTPVQPVQPGHHVQPSVLKGAPPVTQQFQPVQPVVTSQTRLASNELYPSTKQSATPLLSNATPSLDAVTLGIKGGLGPLHLLAETLCNPQPESLEEPSSPLYTQRSNVRKSLFEFMSLKFTDLEKLSSRLSTVQHNTATPVLRSPQQVSSSGADAGVGLSGKSGAGLGGLLASSPSSGDSKQQTVDSSNGVSSRGWPVVGKCTAHDLRLMAEAAWCDCADETSSPNCNSANPSLQATNQWVDDMPAKINGNRHRLASPSDSVSMSGGGSSSLTSQAQSTSDSKMMLNKMMDGMGMVSSYVNGNGLEQNSTINIRECKKNSLRLAKALFNHLAENQQEKSESWPRLYAQIAEDECARRRLIDIVSALSSFRSESTSIRRDNVEFAFAMDDLRAKVLEHELNTPLQFDRQFIEVEQFLQQSVKLVLANIDPERARMASMRYRSLLPGPASPDDQCVELHQRLLAKNYPTDCNPNQFGQLPDVLRMTAKSLELWSLEIDLAKYNAAKRYGVNGASNKLEMPVPLKSRQEIESCIVSLVDHERM